MYLYNVHSGWQLLVSLFDQVVSKVTSELKAVDCWSYTISVLRCRLHGFFIFLQLSVYMLILVCEENMFGFNCESTCHCPPNDTCDPQTGFCKSTDCAHGYHGAGCQICKCHLVRYVTLFHIVRCVTLSDVCHFVRCVTSSVSTYNVSIT